MSSTTTTTAIASNNLAALVDIAAKAWAAAKEAARRADPELYEEAESADMADDPDLCEEDYIGRRWAQLWALVPEEREAATAASAVAWAAFLAAEVDPYEGYEPTEQDVSWGAVGCPYDCGECRYCKEDRDPDQG